MCSMPIDVELQQDFTESILKLAVQGLIIILGNTWKLLNWKCTTYGYGFILILVFVIHWHITLAVHYYF
jgi:hypothetical protein